MTGGNAHQGTEPGEMKGPQLEANVGMGHWKVANGRGGRTATEAPGAPLEEKRQHFSIY